MNIKKLSLFSLLATLAFGNSAYAANNTSASANIKIITPISISQNTALNFGSIIAGASAGTVAISAAAGPVRTPTTVTVIPASAFSSGVFTVTGENTAAVTYAITLPSNGVVTVSDGASHTMNVNNFVSSPSGTGTLTSGTQTLYVGATISVGINQAVNTYTGTYNVVVNYN